MLHRMWHTLTVSYQQTESSVLTTWDDNSKGNDLYQKLGKNFHILSTFGVVRFWILMYFLEFFFHEVIYRHMIHEEQTLLFWLANETCLSLIIKWSFIHLVHRFQIETLVTVVFGPHIEQSNCIGGYFNVWYPEVYVCCYMYNFFSSVTLLSSVFFTSVHTPWEGAPFIS